MPRTSERGSEAICPECGRHVRHAYRGAPVEVVVPGDPNCRALLVDRDELTGAEIEALREGEEDIRVGRVRPYEETRRELGLGQKP